jgi:arylsulfatase A-like enzyme
VRVPARQPDAREVRLDWAQYHDQITVADGNLAQRLAELKQAGLSDSTIVFFYGDNGPGMPGFKRSARDSGLMCRSSFTFRAPSARGPLPMTGPASKAAAPSTFSIWPQLC